MLVSWSGNLWSKGDNSNLNQRSHQDAAQYIILNIILIIKNVFFLSIDFGLSNTYNKDELMKTRCGSLEYAAPELFDPTEKYGPEVDVWSM